MHKETIQGEASMNYRVTVLVAAYNADKFRPEMLDSLVAQTDKDFKLVVVDDCSTDTTSQIFSEEKRLDIQIVRNPENLGLQGR